jgi:hypothetical protein
MEVRLDEGEHLPIDDEVGLCPLFAILQKMPARVFVISSAPAHVKPKKKVDIGYAIAYNSSIKGKRYAPRSVVLITSPGMMIFEFVANLIVPGHFGSALEMIAKIGQAVMIAPQMAVRSGGCRTLLPGKKKTRWPKLIRKSSGLRNRNLANQARSS